MTAAKAGHRSAAGRSARRAVRPVEQAGRGRHDVARQSGAGRRAGEVAGGRHVGRAGRMSPDEIRSTGKWPKGFLPLPHPNHAEGGMVFPKFHIDEIKKQEERDLTRFDLDFDLPDHFLPEFPPPIFLTTRPDLGDVSQGKLVTIDELLRAVQRHPQPEAARRPAAAGDAVSAAAVQRDRRPPHAAAEPRRGLLRLPRQRPHERGDAPGRRHPAAGVPPSHRHAVAARREHPAAVRLAAGAEDASRTSPSSSSGRRTSTATR